MPKKSSESSITPRYIALELLLLLEKEPERLSHLVLRDTLDKYDYLSKEDKAFIKLLTEGTIERKLTLDYVIDRFSSVKTDKQKPFIRVLLRMSTYQILYMDRVPDRAAIDEAVKEAKKHSFSSLAGFVNGVLRNISRDKDKIVYPKRGAQNYLSVNYSVPKWLGDRFMKWYGGKEAEMMLKGSLSGDIVLRVPKAHKAEFLKANGEYVTLHPYADNAYTLKDKVTLGDLTGFYEGLFTVQDISSILAVMSAGIKEGDSVLDVCAAPGGKTCYACELTGPKGSVKAFDLSEEKLYLIEDNAERLNVPEGVLTVAAADASVSNPELFESADVLLADLPCSGLGVLGKKSDIKYHVTEESLESLEKLQRNILNTVCSYVKPGGTLLFSTCTVNPGENIDNFKFFLAQHPEYAAVSLTETLPKELLEKLPESDLVTAGEGYLQLRQGIHLSDGFFLARCMRRN